MPIRGVRSPVLDLPLRTYAALHAVQVLPHLGAGGYPHAPAFERRAQSWEKLLFEARGEGAKLDLSARGSRSFRPFSEFVSQQITKPYSAPGIVNANPPRARDPRPHFLELQRRWRALHDQHLPGPERVRIPFENPADAQVLFSPEINSNEQLSAAA
jgi:hypothetical protein